MENYQDKYLKYKMKYLDLKNIYYQIKLEDLVQKRNVLLIQLTKYYLVMVVVLLLL